WRSEWPKSSGSFIWQLDDCWPGTSWAILDYYARPKAATYAVKAAYAPVMVTGVYEPKEATLPLIVCSDLAEPFKASVLWKVTDTDGKSLASGNNAVNVPAGTVAAAGPKLNLKDAVAKSGRKNLIVWVDVQRDGKTVASNVLLPSRPKDMPLQDPQLSADVVTSGDGFDVTIKAAKPALWAWADLPGDPDAKWSNNFVHVSADKPLTLYVKPSKSIDLDELKKTLIVRSLFDTAAPKPPAEARVVKPSGDGTLVAGAQLADISGDSARYEEGNPPNIGAWSNADDELQWTVDVPKPGFYSVVAELSCPRGTEGSRIEVGSGASKAVFVVPSTNNWGDYKTTEVGAMRFDKAGPAVLKLRVLSKPKSNVMNLRSLTLAPKP
ncbi:MAG: glycoside hydrolase family 2 protein, partial [Phycisphaerales bacterium]|nr:glycoside hydrolase family 2 protein [Phycisphaerales bacterium]